MQLRQSKETSEVPDRGCKSLLKKEEMGVNQSVYNSFSCKRKMWLLRKHLYFIIEYSTSY